MHTLPKFDFNTLTDTETPINPVVVQEMLRYFLVSKAWHDDLEEVHRKVRLWKGRMWMPADPAVIAVVEPPPAAPEPDSPFGVVTVVAAKPAMKRVTTTRVAKRS